MPKWLQSVGIAEDEITAAENAADPAHAMSELAKRAMASTLGEASMATTFGEAAAAQAARFDPWVKPFTAEEVVGQGEGRQVGFHCGEGECGDEEGKGVAGGAAAQARGDEGDFSQAGKEVEDAKAKVQAKTADLKEAEKKKASKGSWLMIR